MDEISEESYRKLRVWKASMELAEAVYKQTARFPGEEKFGLISQMRRCSVSIPSNIAEGYAREHRGDYIRHLSFSRGSLAELETQLILSEKLGYTDSQAFQEIWPKLQSVGRMLTKLIQSLK